MTDVSFYVSSYDKWMTAAELVCELNDIKKAYEKIYTDYAKLTSRFDDNYMEYVEKRNENALLHKEVNKLREKLIRTQHEEDDLIKDLIDVIKKANDNKGRPRRYGTD